MSSPVRPITEWYTAVHVLGGEFACVAFDLRIAETVRLGESWLPTKHRCHWRCQISHLLWPRRQGTGGVVLPSGRAPPWRNAGPALTCFRPRMFRRILRTSATVLLKVDQPDADHRPVEPVIPFDGRQAGFFRVRVPAKCQGFRYGRNSAKTSATRLPVTIVESGLGPAGRSFKASIVTFAFAGQSRR